MKKIDVRIKHIYHSGFTLETKNHFLVFDYYKGPIELSNKDSYVFSSHGHDDHFNPIILNWDDGRKIDYIFSSDIQSLTRDNIHYLRPYKDLSIDEVEVKTFSSTDLGVSFLVKVDGVSIFFAGDLNWWYWKDDSREEKASMERAFKKKISRIIGEVVDIAFFPVDPRLEENYHLGGEYFIHKIQPKFFFPMHFGDKYGISKDFIHKMGDIPTHIVDVNKENQSFHIEI